jgi:BASS family bile acid:Na+ symporter
VFNKLFDWITRLLIIWVLAACAIGYIHPDALLLFKPYRDWLFSLTMLGIGLALNPQDFKPLVTQPRLVVLGTVAQFAIMPVLGFIVAKALRLPPDLALGVILVGSAPGAMASTVISYIAKADVAYSISLTISTTLLAPILTPTFTYLFGNMFIPVDALKLFLDIMKMVIGPAVLGLALKHYLRARIEKAEKVFPAVSTICISLICGIVVALNQERLASVSLLIFVAVLLHNGLGLLLGYRAGLLYKFNLKRRRTLAFEVGMQNAGLGAVLAMNQFKDHPAVALPNALFMAWCLVTASILAVIWGWKEPPAAEGEPA